MISSEKTLTGVIRTTSNSFVATVTRGKSLSGTLDKPTTEASYVGSYEVTPSNETQTIHCGGYHMGQDITIAPVPQNYGLITYNGSTITVS